MTKDNGKVSVTSTVPSLGAVTGTLTLAQILTGTTATPSSTSDDAPVVSKPLAKK